MMDPFAVPKNVVISTLVTVGSVSADLFIIDVPYSCDKLYISTVIAGFIAISFGGSLMDNAFGGSLMNTYKDELLKT
jgi:hypothetical protein